MSRTAAIVLLPIVVSGCGGGGAAPSALLPPSDPARLFFAPELDIDLGDFERTSSGLYVQDLEEGKGVVARRESRVWIYYIGWLPDGTVFDGNVGGEPFHFRLGGNEVIRGWNEGIVGIG